MAPAIRTLFDLHFSPFQALLQVAKNLFTHLGECTALLNVDVGACTCRVLMGLMSEGVSPAFQSVSHLCPASLPTDDVSVLLQEIITEARNLSNAEM